VASKESSKKPTRIEATTKAVLEAAESLAARIRADHILVLANGKVDREALRSMAQSHKVVLALASKRWVNMLMQEGFDAFHHTSPPLDRVSRIAHAVLSAIAKDVIKYRAGVVSVSGPLGTELLDNITIIRTERLFKEVISLEHEAGERRGLLAVIKAVLDICLELGAYGIEGRPVGTIFVVGDTASVLKLSRQITFNPFKGYDTKQKNVLNPAVRDSIKSFAQIDGAFVIKEDGVVNSAGRLLLIPKGTAAILKGMGARHNAAAFITRETEAIAIVVSQTTGTVSVLSKGRVLLSFSPTSRTAGALYTAKKRSDEPNA